MQQLSSVISNLKILLMLSYFDLQQNYVTRDRLKLKAEFGIDSIYGKSYGI